MAIVKINGITARPVLAGFYLVAAVVIVSYANANENWDRDDDIISTTEVHAVLGHSASLPCDIQPSTKGESLYMVLWFRDHWIKPIYSFDVRGRPFQHARNWSDDSVAPRAHFKTSTKVAALFLEGVQVSDEGVYRCRVDFRNSPTRNFQVNLTVIHPPHQLLIYDSSGRAVDKVVGPYQVGAELSLSCEVRGGKPSPTITWYVNDKKVKGIEDIQPNIVVSKLTVSQLTRKHLNTTYKCQASNTDLVPPLEKSILLDVHLEPLSVKILQKPPTLEAEKTYELNCEVIGSHPRATVRWLEANTTFGNGRSKDSGNASVVLSTLKFSPTHEDNGKNVKCRGENTAIPNAFREDFYHLNVVFPPRVQLHLGSTLNPQNIKEGDDVYFECKVLANPAHHKITWRHNGQILTDNRTSGIIMSTQSLVLQKIKRDNGGNYTCLASNDLGETTSSMVHLRVQFSPVCKTKEVMTIGASLDESVKVRCEVEADPSQVVFFWEFNYSGENFEISPVKYEGNNSTTSEIIHTPANERDYGALTCWGRNIIGKQEAPCVYRVIPAGKFTVTATIKVTDETINSFNLSGPILCLKPSPLSNCTIKASLNQTSEVLEVECVAGYDGGLKQDFRLEAYDVRTNSLRINISSISNEIPLFRIPVSELLPATHFYLTAYAINAKGKSEVSILEDIMLRDSGKPTESGVSVIPLVLLLIGCLMALGITVLSVMLMMYRRRGTTSPVHVEPYMKQPIISPPDSRNNSMLDVTHGDHTYFVEYTLKQAADYALNNQPDIIQSPQDQEKIKREPQLFLPVRPDTLFAPYDIHKQGLQTNRCSLNPFSAKSWEPISFKADRNLMKEMIIANSIPGPESCV